MRTRETNYSAFERSGIGLSFWSGEPYRRAPPPSELFFFGWFLLWDKIF